MWDSPPARVRSDFRGRQHLAVPNAVECALPSCRRFWRLASSSLSSTAARFTRARCTAATAQRDCTYSRARGSHAHQKEKGRALTRRKCGRLNGAMVALERALRFSPHPPSRALLNRSKAARLPPPFAAPSPSPTSAGAAAVLEKRRGHQNWRVDEGGGRRRWAGERGSGGMIRRTPCVGDRVVAKQKNQSRRRQSGGGHAAGTRRSPSR